MTTRGVFIISEDGDGSGKSTQIQSARDWFKSRGRGVIIIREPDGTELGTGIRRLMQDGPEDVDTRTGAFLYTANRAYHIAMVIALALERGTVMLGDRYIDSSLAYQGAARSLGVSKIASLLAWATRSLYSSLTFLLDLPPEVGLHRHTDASDCMEHESVDFHGRVHHEYLRLTDAEPDCIAVTDAVGTVGEVFFEIHGVLVEHFEGGSITIDKAGDVVPMPTEEAPALSETPGVPGAPEKLRDKSADKGSARKPATMVGALGRSQGVPWGE